jgi:hypothetical protein
MMVRLLPTHSPKAPLFGTFSHSWVPSVLSTDQKNSFTAQSWPTPCLPTSIWQTISSRIRIVEAGYYHNIEQGTSFFHLPSYETAAGFCSISLASAQLLVATVSRRPHIAN